MRPRVTFTLDLEDHRPTTSIPARYPAVARMLLEHLDLAGIRGTVFVVGQVAEEEPELVVEIARRGHEIGLHAWRHTVLTEMTASEFQVETSRGKSLLESLSGQEVVGFRAPTYSLVPETTWAVPILGELGFKYSSSTLPGRNPLHGFPGLPNRPFRWPTGLVEFPGPVVRLGPMAIAPLGGTYLRVLPWPVVAAAARWLPPETLRHTYCHPYDFDPDEPYWQVGDVPRALNRLLWIGRRRMLSKIDRLVGSGSDAGPPLAELVDQVGPVRVDVELLDG